MRIWGITGTNGKTTVTWVAAHFMDAAYITTVEVFDGRRRFSTGYTTPPLKQLREIFATMRDNGCRDCVMEVSSHAIAQNRTGETVFAGGAFTNLSEDHLDYHRTMEEYFRVKLAFAEKIAAGRVAPIDGSRRDLPPYVVCLDGGYAQQMLRACGQLPLDVRPVSERAPAYDLSDLRLFGAYNRSNVLTAAALAEAAGVPRERIQRRIPELVPRWGRLEPVDNPDVRGKVFVDFAHTPDGLDKVLAAARGFTSGRLIAVFGAGGDRDPMKRPLMGAACARGADVLVVTSDNPRSEDPAVIIAGILDGIPAEDRARTFVEPDRARAIGIALAQAQPGDTVIVAGKGHETTQEVRGVKLPFDDRETVRAWRR